MIACKAVDAASPLLEETLKSEIKNTVTKNIQLEKLAESIEATYAKKWIWMFRGEVRPTGVDEKGVRNGEKMAYIRLRNQKQIPKAGIEKSYQEI